MTLPANSISIPTFAPRIGIIIAISQTEQALITLLNPTTFVVGQIVKIVIPGPTRTTIVPGYDYGMPEINNMSGTVIQLFPGFPNSFLIDIDTRQFQAFTLPALPLQQYAQAVPTGEINSHLDGAWRNILPPV